MAAQLTILAAEDEEGDALLLKMAFKKAASPHSLIIVSDGQEALNYLNGDAPYTDRAQHPFPALLLLDLKMPRRTGFDVLEWLAAHPELSLPAIVLSSSSHESDIEKAKHLGALEYYVKPHRFSELVKLAQELHSRWLEATPVA